MKTFLVIAAAFALASFGVWSLYVGSRYQTLCELSYWSASAAELRHCDERAAELHGR